VEESTVGPNSQAVYRIGEEESTVLPQQSDSLQDRSGGIYSGAQQPVYRIGVEEFTVGPNSQTIYIIGVEESKVGPQ
jgi:hypothetical protein